MALLRMVRSYRRYVCAIKNSAMVLHTELNHCERKTGLILEVDLIGTAHKCATSSDHGINGYVGLVLFKDILVLTEAC